MSRRAQIAIVAALVALPILLQLNGNSFEIRFISSLLIWAMLALSLDLIWGYGGIISLGQGVFFGIGAYSLGYFLTQVGGVGGVAIGIVFALILAMALGMGLALISFRSNLGGLFFAILTVAMAIVATLTVVAWRGVTGGDNGLLGIPQLAFNIPFEAVGEYYVILGISAAVFLGVRHLVKSRFGAVLAALRENELRSNSIGYDASHVKAVAFTVAAGVAAIAGMMFAVYNGIVSPTIIGFATGANALIWVGIGGRGHLYGALLGVFVIEGVRFYLTDVLTVFFGSQQALSVWPLFFGGVFLIVVLFYPDGLMGMLIRAKAALANRFGRFQSEDSDQIGKEVRANEG